MNEMFEMKQYDMKQYDERMVSRLYIYLNKPQQLLCIIVLTFFVLILTKNKWTWATYCQITYFCDVSLGKIYL